MVTSNINAVDMLDDSQRRVNSVDMDSKRSDYHHGNLKAEFEKIAWETVQSKGADALSLRACARAAGVDPAAIYRHFKSKDDILDALASRAFAELAETLVSAERGAVDEGPRGQLIAIGMAYVRYAITGPQIFRMMFDQAGRKSSGAVVGLASDGRAAYEVLQDGWARLCPTDDDGDASRFEFALWTGSHGVSSLLVAGLGPERGPGQDVLARDVLETVLEGCLARSKAGGQYAN